MSEANGYKRKRGDTRYGRRVYDMTGLNVIMMHIFPKRTESEVFMLDDFDITDLMAFINERNKTHPEYKTTIFHALVFAIAKMVNERPKMNRFIQGRRTYEHYDISMGFMAKRRFADGAEEKFMWLVPKEDDTLDTLSHRIYGDVTQARKSETAVAGDSIDNVVNSFAKIPRLLLMFIVRVVRWLDFWGKVPAALSEGDSNFASVLITNLGSIKAPAVYHHLNNYGTTSMAVAVGTIHKKEMIMPDGTKQIRDVVDIGVTLDERIADGFYFARSLRVVKYLLANPELLEEQFSTPTGFDYEGK